MGTVISSENIGDLPIENALLKRLAGAESINCNDPQWNQLFSFNFNLNQRSRLVQIRFLEHMNPLLEQLMHNTRETGNLATLIRVFHRLCSELGASTKCENKIFLWQASNCLLIIRFIAVFLAQRLSPTEFANIFGYHGRTTANEELNTDSLAQQLIEADRDSGLMVDFDDAGAHNSNTGKQRPESVAEQLLADLLSILTLIPVNQITLQLHVETIRVILSLLSTQLYEDVVNERSEFLRLLMLKFRSQSGELIRILLENFLLHHAEPLDLDGNRCGSQQGRGQNSSLVVSIWSTLQSALTLGGSIDEDVLESDQFPVQSLSSLSLSLLLTLVYYPAFGEQENPYKHMLCIFQNAQEVSSLANLEASFKLDFTKLYNRLCQTVHKERQPLLLLYLLIHNNLGFRNFILSRVNMEQLVLPVTQVLYDGMCSAKAPSSPRQRRHNSVSSINGLQIGVAASSTSAIHTHQIYLALIVLLMLSEDDYFKKVIHEMIVRNIDWYQPDRAQLSEITLGGLIILIFAKTIQINTIRVRDRYFHMNSLATLANLSSCFKQLTPLVCQKLIGLLETMTKRHTKMIRILRENAEREQPTLEKAQSTADDADDLQELNDDLHRDITALEEGIRTVLEIINASLCHNLRDNPDLVYTILYKRDLFEHYHQHPMFQDLVWNIYAVINHFNAWVGAIIKENNGSGTGNSAPTSPSTGLTAFTSNASVAEILQAIKKISNEWPTDRLKKFPDLRFKYIEDENTVDFFIPYIWRLVHEGAGIHFEPAAIQLFKAVY